jgi:hypothetical protein
LRAAAQGNPDRRFNSDGQPTGNFIFPVILSLTVFACRATDRINFPDGFSYIPVMFRRTGKIAFPVVYDYLSVALDF